MLLNERETLAMKNWLAARIQNEKMETRCIEAFSIDHSERNGREKNTLRFLFLFLLGAKEIYFVTNLNCYSAKLQWTINLFLCIRLKEQLRAGKSTGNFAAGKYLFWCWKCNAWNDKATTIKSSATKSSAN